MPLDPFVRVVGLVAEVVVVADVAGGVGLCWRLQVASFFGRDDFFAEVVLCQVSRDSKAFNDTQFSVVKRARIIRLDAFADDFEIIKEAVFNENFLGQLECAIEAHPHSDSMQVVSSQ